MRNASVFFVAICVIASACSKGGDDPVKPHDAAAALAAARNITGRYTDNYGGVHVISASTWTMTGWGTSIFRIERRDDVSGFIIAQNDATNPYDANLFSRFDYRKEGNGNVAFCQTIYNAASAQAAAAATSANFTNLLSDGCSGFPFSVLTVSPVAQARPTKPTRTVASERKEYSIPRRGSDSIKNPKVR